MAALQANPGPAGYSPGGGREVAPCRLRGPHRGLSGGPGGPAQVRRGPAADLQDPLARGRPVQD
ncbi:hypothetical protein DDV93_16095 [Cereibacter johrii]|nr:hypothetical protein DDV93_16095 [Cereibacter johrii]